MAPAEEEPVSPVGQSIFTAAASPFSLQWSNGSGGWGKGGSYLAQTNLQGHSLDDISWNKAAESANQGLVCNWALPAIKPTKKKKTKTPFRYVKNGRAGVGSAPHIKTANHQVAVMRCDKDVPQSHLFGKPFHG